MTFDPDFGLLVWAFIGLAALYGLRKDVKLAVFWVVLWVLITVATVINTSRDAPDRTDHLQRPDLPAVTISGQEIEDRQRKPQSSEDRQREFESKFTAVKEADENLSEVLNEEK